AYYFPFDAFLNCEDAKGVCCLSWIEEKGSKCTGQVDL
ncbi:unnamed protein product, partial [marine sediment metagenome]